MKISAKFEAHQIKGYMHIQKNLYWLLFLTIHIVALGRKEGALVALKLLGLTSVLLRNDMGAAGSLFLLYDVKKRLKELYDFTLENVS